MNNEYPPEVQWVKKNKGILNLKAVAEQTDIPVKNLWNYCNDRHSLNQIHWKKVVNWVKALKIND